MAEQTAMQKQGVVWDLSGYFPEFRGSEYNDFKKQLEKDEFLIKTKIETIERLVSDRRITFEMFMKFSEILPQDVPGVEFSRHLRQQRGVRRDAVNQPRLCGPADVAEVCRVEKELHVSMPFAKCG